MNAIQNFVEKYPRVLALFAVLILLFALWLIFYSAYWVICLVFPGPISFLILIYLKWRLLKTLCQFLSFPGSFFFIRRGTEKSYGKLFSKRSLMKVQKLSEILNCISNHEEEDIDMIYDENNCSEIPAIKQSIQGLSQTFAFMHTAYNMTRQQINIHVVLSKIIELFDRIRFAKDTSGTISLSDLLDSPMTLSSLIKQKAMVSDEHLLGELLRSLDKLGFIFFDFLEKKPKLERFKRWINPQTLGSLDQVHKLIQFFELRTELEREYEVQRFFLKSFDNKMIDCIIVFADKESTRKRRREWLEKQEDYHGTQEESQDNYCESTADRIKELPTMIYCNPNAAYYEYLLFESDIIEFYTSRGMNIVLWNYRGYGCSQGNPTPQNLFRDGEYLVEYLRKDLNAKKIGIHGQSIGGMVATYVAASKNLDFLIADRTFADMSSIAEYFYGQKIKQIFRILTDWDYLMSTYYLEANCYKILSYDHDDQVIPYLGNLKNSVSKDFSIKRNSDIRYTLLPFPKKPSTSSTWSFSSTISDIVADIKLQFRKSKEIDNRLNLSVFEMISERDFNMLFHSLRCIHEVIQQVSLYRQNGPSANSSSQENSTNIQANKPIQTESEDVPNTSQLNESINLDQTVNMSILLKDDEPTTVSSHSPSTSCDNSMSFSQPAASAATEMEQLSHSTPQKQKQYSALHTSEKSSRSPSDLHSLEEDELAASKKSLIPSLSEEIQACEMFQEFIIHLYSVFSSLDAAGLPLPIIFQNFKLVEQPTVLKQYIINLEAWGSMRPRSYSILKNLNYLGHRKYALIKLKETIKKIREMITQQKTQARHIFFEKQINEELWTIIGKLSIIKERITRNMHEKINEERENDGSDLCLSNRSDEEESKQDNEDAPKEHQSLYVYTSKSTKQEKNNVEAIGYLMPLSCGHNGLFEASDWKIYEFHLARSGFLPFVSV